ncbi:hypothetical protein [Streptomyces sp. NPDC001537]
MAYSRLGEQRLMRSYFERRRRFVATMLLVAVTAPVVLLLGWAIFENATKNDPVPKSNAGEVQLTFGLDRKPVTRTFLLDLKPGKAAGGTEGQEVTVRLHSDLRRSGDAAAEFPSDQITVGLDKLTTTTVNLNVSANPWAPEHAQAGLYEGVLELRGPGISQDVKMSVWLRSRENWRASVALALLLSGSLLGLLVKWITERLTPQAHQIRRLSALKDAIGYEDDRDTIPVQFRLKIRDLEGQIARQDYAGVEESFKELEEQKTSLALLSAQMKILFGQLDEQTYLIEKAGLADEFPRLLLRGAVDGQYRKLQQLLVTSQGTEPEADFSQAAQELATQFAVVLNLMSDFITHDRSPRLGEALSDVRAGALGQALTKYQEWRLNPEAEEPSSINWPSMPPSYLIERQKSRARKRRQVAFLFHYSRAIAGLSSAVVVALVGLKLQYLDNQGFGGKMTDWLGLALWGVIVELSGVSVLEVVGRLGPGGQTAAKIAPK